jgi:ribonuclease BN (tRNA processing enzyme)
VGCSGSIPGPDGPASCYLIEEQGFRLLLDLGSGALGPLQRHAPLTGIDAICLSHLHADHCLDLCPLWVAQIYAPDGPRPRIPVSGPDGTPERLDRAYGVTEEPGMAGAFDFGTLQPGTRQIGPFEITLARMNHPVETYGFRIAAGGRVIAYSADTGPSGALVSLARDADLLLCEASFLDGPGLPGNLHLTAKPGPGWGTSCSPTWRRGMTGSAAGPRRPPSSLASSRWPAPGWSPTWAELARAALRMLNHAGTRDRRRRVHRLTSDRRVPGPG